LIRISDIDFRYPSGEFHLGIPNLLILNGAGYEKWTKKVSLPMLRTVDTSRSFKDKLIHIETEVTHSHGPVGERSHSGTAFTTWATF